MRKILASLLSISLDVIVTLLFLRPYLTTVKFLSGKMAVLGTLILLLVPTFSTSFVLVVENLRKEEKSKKKFICLLYAIIILLAELIYYMKPTLLTMAIIITVMTIAEIIIAKLYIKVEDGAGTPKSIMSIILDLVLTILTWKYLTTAQTQWIEALPGWMVISISSFIILFSIFFQYAGKKFLMMDIIFGIVINAMITISYLLMEKKHYMMENRTGRFLILLLLGSLIYLGVLYYSKKIKDNQ